MKLVRCANGTMTVIAGGALRLYLLSDMIDDLTVRVRDIFGRNVVVIL